MFILLEHNSQGIANSKENDIVEKLVALGFSHEQATMAAANAVRFLVSFVSSVSPYSPLFILFLFTFNFILGKCGRSFRVVTFVDM